MERIRLRRYMGVRYAYLNPILEELAREGRIRIVGDVISLLWDYCYSHDYMMRAPPFDHIWLQSVGDMPLAPAHPLRDVFQFFLE
jgi:hypothetical protein